MLSILDNVAINTIADFLPCLDHPSLLVITNDSIDKSIFNHTIHTIPRHHAHEFVHLRQWSFAEIWEVISVLLSRKIYIGPFNINKNGFKKLDKDFVVNIYESFEEAIKKDKEGWFLANCHEEHIYSMRIFSRKIFRIVPFKIVSRFIINPKRLRKIYGDSVSYDEIYASFIRGWNEKYEYVVKFTKYNVVNFHEKYPLMFKAFIRATYNGTYNNIDVKGNFNIIASVISHLHTDANCTMSDDGVVHCEKWKNIKIICRIIRETRPVTLRTTNEQEYVIFLTASKLGIDLRIGSARRCLIESTFYDRTLVSGLFLHLAINRD